MKTDITEIEINGEKYVRKADLKDSEVKTYDGKKYQIFRAASAGVFAGFLESITETVGGRVAVVRNARRLWYWSGAASLSQLSIDGTCKPTECKFPAAVDRVELSNVIEILDCTDKAKRSIEAVKIWEQK